MRWLLATVLTLASAGEFAADDLMIYRLSGGTTIAVKSGGGKFELVGVLGTFDTVTVIEPSVPTPPQPVDEPTGPGQLICLRPWSCTLDESDADLTIRETLDAVASQVPYIRLLPGTPDQRLQIHPAERYRTLVKDATQGLGVSRRPHRDDAPHSAPGAARR